MAPNPRLALVRKHAQERLQALYDEVTTRQQGVGFMNYLKMMTKQQRSVYNTWLIYVQCPEASFCLGYKQWLNVGRHVRKGEKGLLIYRPIPLKKKTGEEPKENEIGYNGLTFTTTYVWDISQTEVIEGMEDKFSEFWESLAKPVTYGAALPVNALHEYCHKSRIFLENSDEKLLGCYGYATTTEHPHYSHLADQFDHIINIKHDLEDALYSRTLIHELAHVLLHLSPDNKMNADARKIAEADGVDESAWYEWEAEATAYTVFSHYGIELDASAQYLSRYIPPVEFLLYSTNRIYNAAQKIIKIINTEEGVIETDAIQTEEAYATAA